jgi:electron transport complex protein RnfB
MLLLCLIFVLLGLVLGYAAQHLKVQGDPIVEQLDALLPQTQCGQCKYPGCKPYAQAIVQGKAKINQCPPGGEQTINALADLLGIEAKPLNAEFGVVKAPAVAFIVEQDCIGCVKCIPPCPVDAILGASKQMHTVIASECTGCELCIAPCPVDCIIMIPIENNPSQWQWSATHD